MRNLGVNKDKLVFQCYDFASNMSGCFKGTQTNISEKLGRNVPYLRCLAHRGNIIVEHCCESSSFTHNMFGVLQQTYNIFTRGSKRFNLYRKAVEEIEGKLHLKEMSETSGSARSESLEALWSVLPEVVGLLREMTKTGFSESPTGFLMPLLDSNS